MMNISVSRRYDITKKSLLLEVGAARQGLTAVFMVVLIYQNFATARTK